MKFGNRFSLRSVTGVLAATGLAVTLVSLAACQVTRKPDGTWTVENAPDLTKDGIYSQQTIGGKCFLSNGTWCIPCGGGKLQSCADIRDILEPAKPANPSTNPTPPGGGSSGTSLRGVHFVSPLDGGGPSDTLMWSFKAMTGGLPWDQIPDAFGMDGWKYGEAHQSAFSLNFYDSDTGVVDITYLGEFNDLTPRPGNYLDASGHAITVEILYAGGDPNDNVPDPIGVRVRGQQETVAALAKASMVSFDGEIDTDYGRFGAVSDGQTVTVTLDGTTLFSF